MRVPVLVALLTLAIQTSAAAETTEERLAEVARLGGLAAVVPLCGLRDDGWAVDLRLAAMQSITGRPEPNDSGHASRDQNLAAAAVAHGDLEATEDFAERTPAASCEALRTDPALPGADAMVGEFRQREHGVKPGS
jgi:hypothetical protein